MKALPGQILRLLDVLAHPPSILGHPVPNYKYYNVQ